MVFSLSITAAAALSADDFKNGNLSGITEASDGKCLITDTYNKVVWEVNGDKASIYAGRIGVADASGEPVGEYQNGTLDKAYFMEPWDIVPFVNGYAVSDSEAKVIRYIEKDRVYTVEDTNKKITFKRPTGLATDKYGQLYISDTEAGAVYLMDRDGHVSLVASGLVSPTGIAWTEDAIYVAETGMSRLAKIVDGKVSAFAGVSVKDDDGYLGGYVDGPVAKAMFEQPQYVAVGSDGTVYVSDTGNSAVRAIKDGRVYTIARPASGSQLPTSPRGICVSGTKLLVADNFIGNILAASVATKSYKDVPANAWFASFVNEGTMRGLINGMSQTEFSPNAQMNRAMFVTILSRIYQSMDGSAIVDGDKTFGDVADNTWYSAPVRWAADAGVTNGDGGNFAPNRSISREEVVTMLYRYAKAQGFDVTTTGDKMSGFKDAGTTSSYAVDAMEWACEKGIMNGSEGMLTPHATATRAQATKIMVAFMDAYGI